MGIMAIGAIDVPRGCDATEKDLAYILSFADCKTVIAENSTQVIKIANLKDQIPTLKQFIIFDEPIAGLDPKGRSDVLKMIKDYLTAYNATVIIISHNIIFTFNAVIKT